MPAGVRAPQSPGMAQSAACTTVGWPLSAGSSGSCLLTRVLQLQGWPSTNRHSLHVSTQLEPAPHCRVVAQDGAAFLLERRGDVHSALKIYIQVGVPQNAKCPHQTLYLRPVDRACVSRCV